MNIPVLPQIPQAWIKGSGAAAEQTSPRGTADLGRAIELVLRRRWTVAITCLCGMALSVFVGFVLMPNYTASTLLAVPTTAQSRADDSSLLDTHITMLKSHGFLSRVAAALAKDGRLGSGPIRATDLERHTNVMQELKSSLISVNETAKSPVVAAIIANTIADTYIDELTTAAASGRSANIEAAQQRLEEVDAKIKDLAARLNDPATGEADRLKEQKTLAALQNERADLDTDIELALRQTSAQIRNEIVSPAIRIAARAEAPQRPSSMKPMLVVVPGAIASLIAGVALALALSLLDPRLQGVSDIVEQFGVPALENSGASSTAQNAASELMITLLSAFGPQQKRVLVTSCRDADGRDVLVEKMARDAAHLRPSVLVVDLVSPSTKPEGVIYRAAGARFDRMNCSTIFCDESISAPDLRLREMIAKSSSSYEWIIVNAPPVLQIPAIRLLTNWISLAVVAARSDTTLKAHMGETLQMLTCGALGDAFHGESTRLVVVLTRSPETRASFGKLLGRFGALRAPTKTKSKALAAAKSGASTATGRS